jgi:DNA-binding MarR family transcriptional regulator
MDALETPLTTGGADEFLGAFEVLTQAIRRARGAVPQDRDLLTISQLALLTPLSGGHPSRVSDLAGEAGISPSTATRILDALERRGIVDRARSPEDRRGVTITLTGLGRDVLHRQDAWVRERKCAFYDELPLGEQAVAAGLLVRLASLVGDLAVGPGL